MIAANVRLAEDGAGRSQRGAGLGPYRRDALPGALRKVRQAGGGGNLRHILETSERVSREAVSALPDGTYTADDWVDGDGISEERFPTRVAVTIAGDTVTVDYTGSCEQLQGPVNCSRSALVSAVKTIFKAIVDPQSPSNEGWFRPLKVVAPDGTVFTATKPAPVGWYYEGTGQASELAWKALAPIAPKRVSMGSANSLCVTVLGGHDRAKGEPWVMIEPSMVGWGRHRRARRQLRHQPHHQRRHLQLFHRAAGGEVPVRVNQYTLNTPGGVGAGRYRGRLRLDPRVRDHDRRRGAFGKLRPLDREALGARGAAKRAPPTTSSCMSATTPGAPPGRPPRS